MIELSLNEVEALAAKVARGAGFPWGLADDIGRAARALAMRGAPWAEALLALARHAGDFEPPSPERAARWRRGEMDLPSDIPLCPVRTAALLTDTGLALGAEPLRLERVGLPIWIEGLLAAAGPAWHDIEIRGDALSFSAAVAISPAAQGAVPARVPRATIALDLLADLNVIAGRVYVPESERSRARGAGGGTVDEE